MAKPLQWQWRVPVGAVLLKRGYLFRCEHDHLLTLKADTTLELIWICRLFQQRQAKKALLLAG